MNAPPQTEPIRFREPTRADPLFPYGFVKINGEIRLESMTACELSSFVGQVIDRSKQPHCPYSAATVATAQRIHALWQAKNFADIESVIFLWNMGDLLAGPLEPPAQAAPNNG